MLGATVWLVLEIIDPPAVLAGVLVGLAVIAAFLFTLLVDRSENAVTAGMMAREAMLNAGRLVGISVTLMLLVLDFDLSISMFVAAAATATVIAVK